MSSDEEELALATAAVAGLNNVVSMVQGISSNVRNVRYDSQTNTTTYYGHTNFEELKVNGNNVALASHNHDSSYAGINHNHNSTYAALSHTHDINDVILTYEEEEQTLNEEEETVTTTITKTKTLSQLLDGKADLNHTHSTFNYGNSTLTLGSDGALSIKTANGWDSTKNNSLLIGADGLITFQTKKVNNYLNTVQFGVDDNHIFNIWQNWRGRTSFLSMNSYGDLTINGSYYPLRVGSYYNRYKILMGNTSSNNNSGIISFKDSTTPHTINLGFYGNEDRLTVDTSGNVNITGNITANGVNINTTLANKANSSHTHSLNDVVLTYEEEEQTINEEEEPITTTITKTKTLSQLLDGKADLNHNHDSTYAGISHNHSIGDITNLQTALDGKASTSHNHDSSYAGISHSHSIGDITNLQTTLNGKAASNHNHDSTYAAINHTHDYSSTYAAIDHDHDSTYAGINHSHSISDITNLQTTLDGKAASNHNHDSTYAALSHSHAISDITNLQTTLDGKAASNHNHDSAYSAINHNHDSSYAALSHNHNFSDIKTCKGKVFRPITGNDITFTNITKRSSSVSFDYNVNKNIVSNGTITIKIKMNIRSHNTEMSETITYPLSIKYYTTTNNNNQLIWVVESSDFIVNNEYEETITAKTRNHETLSYHNEFTQPLDFISFEVNVEYWIFNSIESITYETNLMCEDYETVTNNDSNNDIEALSQLILKRIYPVGSIYTSMSNISPRILFNFGTWTQIVDRFLYCSNSSGNTGGNSTHTHTTSNHTLTVEEMPNHNHAIYSGWGEGVDSNESDVYRYQRWALNDRSWKSTGVLGTSATGGLNGTTQPHNHGNTGSASTLPPYITVYAWQRVA